MNKIVVLMKTHVWNDDIEKFAIKIYDETQPNGIDFFILMHTENDELYKKINTNYIKDIVLKFTEQEIKKIYSVGFFTMWLSNHWILMWFYKQFGKKYEYFWSMEYDVRISGDSSKIWKYPSRYDFLYTMGNYRNSRNKYRKYYIGGKLSELDKFYGYLQLARYSNNALEYLDKCYEEGENGQDELITYSLLIRGKLTGSKKFLRNLISGTWTWHSTYSDYNRKIYNQIENSHDHDKNNVRIFHPIK